MNFQLRQNPSNFSSANYFKISITIFAMIQKILDKIEEIYYRKIKPRVHPLFLTRRMRIHYGYEFPTDEHLREEKEKCKKYLN